MRLISAGSLVRAQSGPVFARVAVEREDCRAVALAKADIPVIWNRHAASYDSASHHFFLFLQLLQGFLGSLNMIAFRIGLDRFLIPFSRRTLIARLG